MAKIYVFDLDSVIKSLSVNDLITVVGGEWSGSGGCSGVISKETTTFVCGDGNWMTRTGDSVVSGNFNSANSPI